MFQKNYIATHEVVDKPDKKYIHFYEIDKRYCVTATIEKINDQQGFYMNTSSGTKSKYFKYGLLTFRLRDSLLHLYVYQSEALMKKEKLKEYLFVLSEMQHPDLKATAEAGIWIFIFLKLRIAS